MNGKNYITAILIGAALVGCGIFFHWQHSQFLANAVHSSAEIVQIHDDSFVTSAADIQPASMLLHRCKYTISFTPDQKTPLETQISEIAKSCLPKEKTIQILYDKFNPAEVMFYASGFDDVFVGKIWITFGVIILGIAYFMWVGEAQRR